jgi:predicted DCC family thiol-disulfide oxidoreductase YuxK
MTAEPDWIFYDGSCGLCHHLVKFVIARGDAGRQFHFAPLFGDRYRRFEHVIGKNIQSDSVVVLTASGRTLTRSTAAAYILRALGGIWFAMGWLLQLVPEPLRDAGYSLVARTRHKLFARPQGSCPIMPPEFRQRFDT